MVLFDRWCWKMAWRDSRAHRGRLFLFLSCICLGVAALVALRSFGTSVKIGIVDQSKGLLGADLLVKSRSPHPQKLIDDIKKVSTANVREQRFASMGKFPSSPLPPRLVQVRGVESGFPIYGEVETQPAGAVEKLFDGSQSALIDESLRIQFKVQVGDKIQLGKQQFTVVGFIQSLPGESFMVSELSPRVLICYDFVKSTQLITFGSRVFYRHYFKYGDEADEEKLLPLLEDAEVNHGVSHETIEDRQEAVDRTLSNLFHFLNLVAFIALLLGGIGIGSAIRVHINSKLQNAAILRCLGASRSQAVGVYTIQALCMGFAGGLLGSAFGIVLQQFLPSIIGALMPLEIETSFSWQAVLLGIGMGTAITFLFALTPLLKLSRMTAADSLRSSINIASAKTAWSWVIYLVLAGLVIGFSIMSASKVMIGVILGIALIISLALLVVMAWGLMQMVELSVPRLLPFIWRQGLKNLYRPQNQTLMLICSLGTGTFLIAMLFLTQENMLYQVRQTEEGNNPNIVLFDIQVDQVEEVRKVLKEQQLEALDVIPLVGMRLRGINNKSVPDLIRENREKPRMERVPNWPFQRTYRSTYRDKLGGGETIMEGKFIPKVDSEKFVIGETPVPISVELGFAELMQLKLGDKMIFDVEGINMPCVITSIRKVEWMQMRPNFFIVFPTGVLENAPQMIAAISRTPTVESSVALQKKISDRFANISVLDLTQVVSTVTNMLDKASLAVKIMAGFSIITGLIILISSLHLSQLQRLKDNTLLKVLGASKRQVVRILFSEFCFLAIIAANAGALLAYAGNWAMSEYVFESHMPFNWSLLLMSNALLLLLTVIIGFFVSAKTYRKTSLEVLRGEN